MSYPHLTFFCELGARELGELFDDPQVIEGLQVLQAGLSLAILDHSRQRAEVVRRLNEAGIPVTAWLLLSMDKGYYFNLRNYEQTQACYKGFQAWTAENGLVWAGVGLDVEPDFREMQQLAAQPWKLLPDLLRRSLSGRTLSKAQAAYADLAKAVRKEGYTLESYQYPLIADERKVRSTLLRRVTGVVDVPVDREVWMLYTSLFPQHGVGYLWSYAPEAKAIGLGSTGGGINPGIGSTRTLSWDEFSRDLRLAWYWSDHLYIFSLEGCVHQGFLEPLKSFTWDQPILFPEAQAEAVSRLRSSLQSVLWLSKYSRAILASGIAAFLLISRLRQWIEDRVRD
jgi:hypothetical protein